MLYTSLLSAAVFAASALAAPTPSQLPADGFPNPSADQLTDINKAADGTLSTAPPPPSLNASSIPIFQLINFNENFEVAFFNSLIYNITNDVSGFQVPFLAEKTALINVLTTVLAQEELHAINAANVISHFGGTVPTPCTYKFPTSDLISALNLAETFTALVLGTLQDASQGLSTNGDHGPVRAVASVIGQEGEQNGFFRSLLNAKPSEKPFLTTSIAPFAFSALQDFIVSCPFDIPSTIPIPIFPTISVQGGSVVSAEDQTLTFTADLTGVAAASPYYGNPSACTNDLSFTYFTGQDAPISKPISNVSWSGDVITFSAEFPFTEYVMDGLSIGSLTTSSNFSNPDAVASATLAAPALIQVVDPIL
ncbi:hypothetical protein SEUCBS139899_003036 [Sporothrix eucalyptigena]|uniref:Sexual development protein n=1 Tax=Sporothrix eucalyptigena TaxID=1812306 RepID=A0ABP0CLH9_9PEZI